VNGGAGAAPPDPSPPGCDLHQPCEAFDGGLVAGVVAVEVGVAPGGVGLPDDVSGGGDFMKRPGMVALLSYLDAQKSGQDADEGYVVIFDDLKRFARDTEFHLKLRKAFQARDARVECLNFKFEDTPEGKFIETILAAQGALEREQNGRQVVQKMRARLQGGYWVFKPPVGYRYEKSPAHGKLLVRDEPMATQITEALEGYASGRFDSQAEVKRFLESQPEFPKTAKGTVRQTEVTDILTRPTYAGYLSHAPWSVNWIKGHREPLISLSTFEKIQERRERGAKAPARKNINEDFPLRGFVLCGDVDTPLTAGWSKSKTNKKHPYYFCRVSDCAGYGKSIRRDDIEGEFATMLKSLHHARMVLGRCGQSRRLPGPAGHLGTDRVRGSRQAGHAGTTTRAYRRRRSIEPLDTRGSRGSPLAAPCVRA